eukprot:380828-Prymnesium_polylepis.2
MACAGRSSRGGPPTWTQCRPSQLRRARHGAHAVVMWCTQRSCDTAVMWRTRRPCDTAVMWRTRRSCDTAVVRRTQRSCDTAVVWRTHDGRVTHARRSCDARHGGRVAHAAVTERSHGQRPATPTSPPLHPSPPLPSSVFCGAQGRCRTAR